MKKLRLWAFTLLLLSPLFLPMRVATAQLKATLEGHTKVVWSVAFSPDGGTLASGSWGQTVRLWDVDTEQLLHILTEHTNEAVSVAFSTDGDTLVSGDWDGTIRLWNPHTGKQKRKLTVQTGWVNPVAFIPDEATLLIGGHGISVWDTDIGQYKVPLTEDIGEVVSVVFSPDGQTIASGGADNLVRLWDFTPSYYEVPFVNSNFDITNIPEPVPPPAVVRDFFDLTPFYQQWINVGGFPVLASAKVNPHALKEAIWVIWQMIGHRPDILKAIAQDRQRLSVLSVNESLGDLPEYDIGDIGFFYADARDIVCCGTTTAAEENLFCSDSAYCYSFLIHEFAHTMHLSGLNMIDPTFDSRVRATYNEALEKGLWKGLYAASNQDEYWAEGVGSWFHAADFRNPVKTRDALKAYDPSLALLIAEIFGDGDWRYTPSVTRMHLPHLQGFNPQEAFRIDGAPLWAIRAVELEKQLKDPNSDGGGKWVDLKLYHPSLLPSLIESTTRGDGVAVLFVNLTGNDISFYFVDADGTEHFHYRSTVGKIRELGTYVGAI